MEDLFTEKEREITNDKIGNIRKLNITFGGID